MVNKLKNIWSVKLTTASLVLIPAAIGINYVAKLFASMLKLPLWLGTLGTCISACLAGPVVGGIAGFLTNIVYGLTIDPISTVYSITAAAIGVSVGIAARLKYMSKWHHILITSLIVAAIAIIISTPLNMIYWGGTTGNVWGDAVFAAMGSKGFFASFVDELVVDIPDKIVVLFLAAGIYKVLPKSLIAIYQSDDEDLDK
ncbi:ECF transporter S component [Bifidobacteriaceae bacterium NR002]|nr:ECF transporter S component [Bifidobacteriaceae bacterium NR002]MDZ7549796.1 ECF transporter S component [Bifidobacteriaceae bacterium NR047]